MLYQLGSVTFEIVTPNLHEFSRSSSFDYAAKDVIGTMRPREAVGEGSDSVSLAGRIFPDKFGGLDSLSDIDKMCRSGTPQILVRGDGSNLGWYTVDSVSEKHSALAKDGVGKMIEFDISLTKCPAPSAASYIRTLLRLFG